MPLPLSPADADDVPVSSAGADESKGPAAVAVLSARTSLLLDARLSSSTSTTTSVAAATVPPLFPLPSMVSVTEARLPSDTVSTNAKNAPRAAVAAGDTTLRISPTPASSLASIVALPSALVTASVGAHKVFDGIPCHQEEAAVWVLHVMVSQVLFPVTVEVIHQVFDLFGAVNVSLIQKSACVEAMVVFQSHQDAAQAQEACNGRCIWDGCCVMSISMVQPPMLSSSHSSSSMAATPTVEPASSVMTDATTGAAAIAGEEFVSALSASCSTLGFTAQSGVNHVMAADPLGTSRKPIQQISSIIIARCDAFTSKAFINPAISNSSASMAAADSNILLGEDRSEASSLSREFTSLFTKISMDRKEKAMHFGFGKPPPISLVQIQDHGCLMLAMYYADNWVFDRGKHVLELTLWSDDLEQSNKGCVMTSLVHTVLFHLADKWELQQITYSINSSLQIFSDLRKFDFVSMSAVLLLPWPPNQGQIIGKLYASCCVFDQAIRYIIAQYFWTCQFYVVNKVACSLEKLSSRKMMSLLEYWHCCCNIVLFMGFYKCSLFGGAGGIPCHLVILGNKAKVYTGLGSSVPLWQGSSD